MYFLFKISTIVKYYNLKYSILIFSDDLLSFQHHYFSLQCHIIIQKSFSHDDLMLKKHFLSMLKTVVLLNIFSGKNDTFLRNSY